MVQYESYNDSSTKSLDIFLNLINYYIIDTKLVERKKLMYCMKNRAFEVFKYFSCNVIMLCKDIFQPLFTIINITLNLLTK